MRAIAACFLVTGCIGANVKGTDVEGGVLDTAVPPAGCEADLPPFPLNLVELTQDTAAPQPPATPITVCSGSDTGWPCVHPNSLARKFVSTTGDICIDMSDPDTCVRFAYAKHAFRSELVTGFDAACDAAMTLADNAGIDTGYDEWAATIQTKVAECPDPAIYDAAMINVYLMDNPFPITQGDSSFNAGVHEC